MNLSSFYSITGINLELSTEKLTSPSGQWGRGESHNSQSNLRNNH